MPRVKGPWADEAEREVVWDARTALPGTYLPDFLKRTQVQVAEFWGSVSPTASLSTP